MSEFEDDLDDQLLELAGAHDDDHDRDRDRDRDRERSKKKKAARVSNGSGAATGSSTKKRKADSDMESEDGSGDELSDPYPYEGKYKDEADKQELLAMTELKREQIFAEREAEKDEVLKMRRLSTMVRAHQGGDDSVARAAKRQHTMRGATKEKAKTLDALKAKRKAKDDSKKVNPSLSPSQNRDRSASPQDMDISDEESEDGIITKAEQEDERLLSLHPSSSTERKKKEEAADSVCTLADLERCRVSRADIEKHCYKKWFQEYVTGAYVRYLIGNDGGIPVYRVCEVHNLAADLVKPYKVNDKLVNQALELKHGKSVKIFNMDKVSNGKFAPREWERLQRVCTAEGIKMPTKQELEKKAAQMQELVNRTMTESDISALLANKNSVLASTNKPTVMSALEKSSLHQQRTLAARRQDYAEVEEIDAKLAAASVNDTSTRRSDSQDKLALVNERNRKANMEAVRQAELAEAERKREERKRAALAAKAANADGDARLKSVPKARPDSANDTSAVQQQSGQPLTTSKAAPKSFEASLLDEIDLDIGEF